MDYLSTLFFRSFDLGEGLEVARPRLPSRFEPPMGTEAISAEMPTGFAGDSELLAETTPASLARGSEELKTPAHIRQTQKSGVEAAKGYSEDAVHSHQNAEPAARGTGSTAHGIHSTSQDSVRPKPLIFSSTADIAKSSGEEILTADIQPEPPEESRGRLRPPSYDRRPEREPEKSSPAESTQPRRQEPSRPSTGNKDAIPSIESMLLKERVQRIRQVIPVEEEPLKPRATALPPRQEESSAPPAKEPREESPSNERVVPKENIRRTSDRDVSAGKIEPEQMEGILPRPVESLHPVEPFSPRWLGPEAQKQARKPEPTIHVTIGRVEVRASVAPAKERPRAKTQGPMSLDEYLRRRSGGDR